MNAFDGHADSVAIHSAAGLLAMSPLIKTLNGCAIYLVFAALNCGSSIGLDLKGAVPANICLLSSLRTIPASATVDVVVGHHLGPMGICLTDDLWH